MPVVRSRDGHGVGVLPKPLVVPVLAERFAGGSLDPVFAGADGDW